jgi:hypothetical protein
MFDVRPIRIALNQEKRECHGQAFPWIVRQWDNYEWAVREIRRVTEKTLTLFSGILPISEPL